MFSGIVIGEEHFGTYNRVHMHLHDVETSKSHLFYSIPVQAYTPGANIFLGDELAIYGRLRHSGSTTDYPSLIGSVKDVRHARTWVWSVVHRIRIYIGRVFAQLFMQEHYDIATGLVIGGSGYLTPTLKEIFTRAGILHILAVSGLHIGFVCLFGYAIFSLTFLPRSIKFIGVMCFVVCYVFVTSFRPSVCRAAFMAGLFGIALVMQRNVDRMHITNIAAFILLIVNPMLLFSLSFQLSFAAVYGIVYLYPKIHRVLLSRIRHKILRSVCVPLAVSCSAQLFTTPLIIHYFQRLSLIAPFSNLLIVPLASCIVFMLYGILIVNLVWCSGAHLVAFFVKLLIDLLVLIVQFTAAHPFSMVRLSIPLPILLCTWGLFIPRVRRYVVFIIGVLMCLTSFTTLSKRMIIMTSAKVMILECPDRRTILFSPEPVDRSFLAQVMDVPDRPWVNYAVTPAVKPDITGQWISNPDPFTILRLNYGDIAITVDSTCQVCYGNQKFIWRTSEAAACPENEVRYMVSNGKKSIYFNRPQHGTIIDDLVTEMRLLLAPGLLL